jgi:hypothetical protein
VLTADAYSGTQVTRQVVGLDHAEEELKKMSPPVSAIEPTWFV